MSYCTPELLDWASSHRVDVEKYKSGNSIEIIQNALTKTVFEGFNSDIAYIMGNAIRELYCAQGAHTACGDNVNPTNEDWVRRKYNTVRDFGMPTLQKGRELERKGRDVNSLAPEYAAHGGGYPIFVKYVSAPIGAIIVSGLSQELDHALIVDTLLFLKNSTLQ